VQQPDRGNHARVLIHHNDMGVPGSFSTTEISVRRSGQIRAIHRTFTATFEVSNIKRKDWEDL
jgi:hypothetical protein